MAALWVVSGTGRARAQSINVPLGTAAGFGLLSGGSIQATNGDVRVLGAVGATGTISGVTADSGSYQRPVVSYQNALADLQQARQYCTGQTGQTISGTLSGQVLAPGFYQINGPATVLAHQSLRLSGNAGDVYIFNITGGLRFDIGAAVAYPAGLQPDRVYWNVSGVVNLAAGTTFTGVVLAGDSIRQTGSRTGLTALLTTGPALTLAEIEHDFGYNRYFSINTLRSFSVLDTSCPVALLQQPGNLVPNPSFEVERVCPDRAMNMGTYGFPNQSQVCSWYTPTGGTPDFFHRCGGSVPLSSVGEQEPYRGGNGYCTLYNSQYTGTGNIREYVQCQLTAPLTDGQTCYAAFRYVRAECAFAASPLGLYLASRTEQANNTNQVYRVNNNTTYVIPQLETPTVTAAQLRNAAAPLQNTVDWQTLEGLITVPAGATYDQLTIGNFRPDAQSIVVGAANTSTAQNGLVTPPYYLIDGVVIWPFPLQPANVTVCAGTTAAIGYASAPVLPSELTGMVQYAWTGPGIQGNANQPQIQVYVTQTSSYVLTITVNGLAHTYPPVTVTTTTPPPLTVTGTPSQLCLGQQPVYMSVTQNSGPYTWSVRPADPSLNVSTSTRSAIVQPTQPGTYTYTVTPPPGSCALPGSFTIQVNPLPTVAFSPRAVQYTCPNQWVVISLAQPVGGTVGWAESSSATGPWTPRAETASQIYPSPAVTTYYQATVTSAAGCVGRAVAMVQVQPPVAITFPGAPYVVTSQQNSQLTAALAPAGLPGIGTWSATPAGLALDPVTGDVDGPTSAPGTYAVCYQFQHINGPSCPTQACTQVTVVPVDCPAEQYAPDYPNGFPTLTGTISGSQVFDGVWAVSGQVTFERGEFITKPGTVFLMEPGSRLEIGKGASFEGHSTTFTASCDKMWDGIYISDGSNSFLLGGDDDNFAKPLPLPDPWGRHRTTSEISHSENGIQWARPARAPVRLISTRFLHNLRGLTLNAKYLGPEPVADKSAIVNCVFDSDPLLFKAPLTGLGYYSFVHLNLDAYNTAERLPIYGNNFNHALVGVLNISRRLQSLHTQLGTPDGNNEFQENLLASYYAETVEDDETVAVGYNHFVFNQLAIRRALSLEVRNTFHEAYPGVLTDLDKEEAGVVVQYASQERPIVVEGNNFDQPVSRQLTSAKVPQIGIRMYNQAGSYQITANTFTDLDAGARLALAGSGANSSITSNQFTDCVRGLVLGNLNTRRVAVVYPQCNTFERTKAGNGNYYTSYGIWFTGAVAFDDYDQYLDQTTRNTTPLKNYFTNAHPYPSTMMWLSGSGYSGAAPKYATYTNLSTDPALPANPNTLINLVNDFTGRYFGADVLSTTGRGNPSFYDDTQSCQGLIDNGTGIHLPRTAANLHSVQPSITLGQNHPNPGVEQVTIPYTLLPGTSAELIVRDVLDGRIVRQVSLRAEDTEVTFSVADLRNGIYAYTLTGTNTAVATRRLMVNR